MAVHTLNLSLVDQVLVSKEKGGLKRHVAVEVFGSAPVGTLTLTAKVPGSGVFEVVADGIIDLASPSSVQIEGAISEFSVNLSGVSGVDKIIVTDTQKIL